jgi:putative transposase
MSGKHVAAVLERLASEGTKPKVIHVDNGPEFVSRALDDWAHRNGVKLDFSRPGRPTDNPFIEAFNGRLRVECLDQSWFASLDEASSGLERFRNEHNTERPHTALDMKTPAEYVAEWLANQPPRQ